MSVTTMIELAAIVTAFAAFACTLAWAEQHTRRLPAARETTPRHKRRPF